MPDPCRVMAFIEPLHGDDCVAAPRHVQGAVHHQQPALLVDVVQDQRSVALHPRRAESAEANSPDSAARDAVAGAASVHVEVAVLAWLESHHRRSAGLARVQTQCAADHRSLDLSDHVTRWSLLKTAAITTLDEDAGSHSPLAGVL